MFNILDLDAGRLIDENGHPIGPDSNMEPLVLKTGKEAADTCTFWNKEYGRRWQPRKVGPVDDSWQARERERLKDGTYERPAYLDKLERDPLHFLHLASKRPGMLAYTKTPQKGMQDLQSIITLQGYIEAYWPGVPAEERAEIEAAHFGAELENDGLKFAKTPDKIVQVYTNFDPSRSGVSGSCMRYTLEEFNDHSDDDNDCAELPKHPCYVYGAGDLAVAYLTNDLGETTDRALCWPEKKIYTRVYGSSELHRLLQKRGYMKSAGYYSAVDPDDPALSKHSFAGARLLRIRWEQDDSVFVVPYCDDVASAREEKGFLVIDPNGSISLRETCGWSDETSSGDARCEHCEGRCGETWRVYVGRRSSQEWCEYCQENRAFRCDYSGRLYDESRVIAVEMADGETWSEYAAEDHSFVCQRTGERYQGERTEVIVDEDGGVEDWGPDARDEHTWECEFYEGDGPTYVSDDVEPVIVHVDGERQKWAPHRAAGRTFVSDFDGEHYPLDQRVVIAGPRYVAKEHEAEARESSTALVCLPSLYGRDPAQLKLNLPDPETAKLEKKWRDWVVMDDVVPPIPVEYRPYMAQYGAAIYVTAA